MFLFNDGRSLRDVDIGFHKLSEVDSLTGSQQTALASLLRKEVAFLLGLKKVVWVIRPRSGMRLALVCWV